MKRKEPTHSEDPIHGPASSSTSPHLDDYEGGITSPKGNDYQVFLSFRERDTGKGFTDYLYNSLLDASVHVFRDGNELRVGDKIALELLHTIMQSKISIPIISIDYASSKWCLRELVLMLENRRIRGQIVLPIYYKVDPSDVRYLKGRFGEAFQLCLHSMDEMEVKESREALHEVSFLQGWESEKVDNGHEGALVKIVVKKVMSELKRLFLLSVPKVLVGIDDRVEHIMSMIDGKSNDTWIIGIYGMGGIGKTTLAKVLYNKLSSNFEHRSFMADIRETSRSKGIKCVQKQLISDILIRLVDVSNVDEGIAIIRSRCASKKVLILLDDVDNNTHLNALVDGSWFKAGSIIIITTRNKEILREARASHMYELDGLSLDQSLILFSRYSFGKDFPLSDYEVISHDVVSTTGGLPLALEVIGSRLCGNAKDVWKATLMKLKKVPDMKVQEKLRISYDALDYEEQQIFLDIACFFSGSSQQSPTYMWDACGFFPRKGIEMLSHLSLIKIDKDGNLMMHNQLRDLGREIVHQENLKKHQKRSRLWTEEAVDVLDSNKGTSAIEALRLENYGPRSYKGEQFQELTNLRFLQVNGANLIGDFQNLLPQLRWLWWERCPSNFAATNFHLKKLVVLNLSWSMLSYDWGGWAPLKMATELKVLNLSNCPSLTRTPDLSAFKSLEILILEGCSELQEIHPSLGDIKTLVILNVKHCIGLKVLPAGVGRMEELKELILYDTAIEEIPISRGCMMKLETLDATLCEKLAQLPEFMDSLVSLTKLVLDFCSIASLPSLIGHLPSLERLSLHGCWLLSEIPDSIGQSTSLTELDLKCTAIPEFPERIGNLQKTGSWTYKKLTRADAI